MEEKDKKSTEDAVEATEPENTPDVVEEPAPVAEVVEKGAPQEETVEAAAEPDEGGEAVEAAESKPAKAVAAAVVTEDEAEKKLPMRWYVVHTYSGHENKVKENILKMINVSVLQDEFGRLIVPTEEVAEMKKGKKTITTRKFFPSYILIEMHMSDESWHLVNGIPGVTSFVGTATRPQALSKTEVDRILGRMDKDKETIIPEIPFTLGEHIRIKDGPFSDFTGVIDEINAEKGKLRVLVSIFGRETPVELDFLQVESV